MYIGRILPTFVSLCGTSGRSKYGADMAVEGGSGDGGIDCVDGSSSLLWISGDVAAAGGADDAAEEPLAPLAGDVVERPVADVVFERPVAERHVADGVAERPVADDVGERRVAEGSAAGVG